MRVVSTLLAGGTAKPSAVRAKPATFFRRRVAGYAAQAIIYVWWSASQSQLELLHQYAHHASGARRRRSDPARRLTIHLLMRMILTEAAICAQSVAHIRVVGSNIEKLRCSEANSNHGR